jgi:hypothetical protein
VLIGPENESRFVEIGSYRKVVECVCVWWVVVVVRGEEECRKRRSSSFLGGVSERR